jgi:hypothetical protein
LEKTKGILHNIEDHEHKEENKVFPTFKKNNWWVSLKIQDIANQCKNEQYLKNMPYEDGGRKDGTMYVLPACRVSQLTLIAHVLITLYYWFCCWKTAPSTCLLH